MATILAISVQEFSLYTEYFSSLIQSTQILSLSLSLSLKLQTF